MLETKESNGIHIVSFRNTDRFNALIVDPVKESLLEYYNKPNAKLALDLKEIKFIDSSGFSVMLTVMKAARNNYGQFKIFNVSAEVKELFKLLQLHNVFEIYSNSKDCLSSFK